MVTVPVTVLLLLLLLLFRSSPVYGFFGRPRRAGCRERSQRSCPPGGLPSLDAKPWFAATVPVAPPLSRRGLCFPASRQRPPGWVRGNAVSANCASRRCGGSRRPLFCPVPFTCLAPRRRGLIQPQTVFRQSRVKYIPGKTFAQKQAKLCGLPRTVFWPWQ